MFDFGIISFCWIQIGSGIISISVSYLKQIKWIRMANCADPELIRIYTDWEKDFWSAGMKGLMSKLLSFRLTGLGIHSSNR